MQDRTKRKLEIKLVQKMLKNLYKICVISYKKFKSLHIFQSKIIIIKFLI